MGRQRNFLKIIGKVGGVDYSHSRNGYTVRTKPQLTADRMSTDVAFEGTRKSSTEFGKASSASKLLREAMGKTYLESKEGTTITRLNTAFYDILKSGPAELKGQRRIMDGNLQLLKGFQFNDKNLMGRAFNATVNGTIDRETGRFTVVIPSFSPDLLINTAKYNTHFKINAVAVTIDFETGKFNTMTQESEMLPITRPELEEIRMEMVLEPGATDQMFLAAGVGFFGEYNGAMLPSKGGLEKALRLIAVA